eukprot:5611519-Amphidinium_carterae.1
MVAVLLWQRRGKAFERSNCPMNPSAPCWHMRFSTSSNSTTSLRADLPLLYAAWEGAVTASDQRDMAWNLLDDHTLCTMGRSSVRRTHLAKSLSGTLEMVSPAPMLAHSLQSRFACCCGQTTSPWALRTIWTGHEGPTTSFLVSGFTPPPLAISFFHLIVR